MKDIMLSETKKQINEYKKTETDHRCNRTT